MSILRLNEAAPTLMEKWGEYITATDVNKRRLVASAMERQYRFIQEQVRRGGVGNVFHADRGILNEDIDAADISTFTKQSLAMVDMVFEQIVIDQLVQVQSMDGPTAFVHTMAYSQGSQGALYGAGSAFNSGLDPNYSDAPSGSVNCESSNEVNFTLTAATMTAEAKRLRAKYTLQAEQDLEAQYGMNLADRLRSFMATEIRRELQGEVIDQLIANAGSSVTWSSTPPAGSVYEGLDPKIWQETLYDAIQDADNDIFKHADGMRGANWICGDPDGLLYLEQLKSFSITDGGAGRGDIEKSIDSYSNKFGVANHRFDIWKMRFMPEETLLLGVKSDNPQEIGHIHATYVPIADLGMFRDPKSACVDVGVMTRYANRTIRPGLFATVTIQ